jgi:hypothetical protein
MPNTKQSNRGNDKTEPEEEHGEHGAAGNDRGDKSGMLSKINMLMEENPWMKCTDTVQYRAATILQSIAIS